MKIRSKAKTALLAMKMKLNIADPNDFIEISTNKKSKRGEELPSLNFTHAWYIIMNGKMIKITKDMPAKLKAIISPLL